MTPPPLISIVVPSFNQAQYLGETLQSLVDQDYPRLQVVIQEGGSTDGSVAIAEDFAARYPEVFQVYVEQDSGQADAINRGFAKAKGDILAFLNSDDTYYPSILHRVAAEIDPARDRYIVMGRCLFTGESSRYAGVEHPAEYSSHFEQLAIWKRGYNLIPQPSVFWHRQVWEECGPLDVSEHHALDYDLFCRFSRRFVFHRVDELWSTYRMHDASKSSQRTEVEVLEISIQTSRKHWGSWLEPLRWRCEFSHWLYQRHFHEHARHHARHSEQALRERRLAAALIEFLKTFFYSPKMARDRLAYGWLTKLKVRVLDRLVRIPPVFTGRYEDAWLGPVYQERLDIPANAERLVLSMEHSPPPRRPKIKVELLIDGASVASKTLRHPGAFSLEADLEPWCGQTITIQIRSSASFIPRRVLHIPDDRRLSVKLLSTAIHSGGL